MTENTPENPYQHQPYINNVNTTNAPNMQHYDESNNKLLAILSHLGGLFFGFIPALIVFVITPRENVMLRKHSSEALNWQITFAIYMLISLILSVILIGFAGLIIFSALDLIFCIIATVKASNNEDYEYPMTFRFVKP